MRRAGGRDRADAPAGRGENLLFGNRGLILLLCTLLTMLLGTASLRLPLDAGVEKMIPAGHPFMREFARHADELKGLGNAIRIVLEAREGTIFTPAYLDTLRRLNDEALFLPGVDRAAMKSLWTPATRWTAVVEGGLEGGPVIPDGFDGSPAAIEQVRLNVERSGEVGVLVAQDYKSSIVFVPLLERDPDTGKKLDYRRLAAATERLRQAYSDQNTGLHIVGFAKVLGDLLEGLQQMLLFFLLSLVIAGGILYLYTRCLRSTGLVLACSVIAVVWQLGLMALLGYGLDPFSILVPFLVFSIGMSHGAQKMNGIMQDIGRGTDKLLAARRTFRRLFRAGLTALLCDVVGFAVLATIEIRAIQELALMASLGVAILIFTNLLLLPVLLSYVGVDGAAALRSLRLEQDGAGRRGGALWHALSSLTAPRRAVPLLAVALALGAGGLGLSFALKIGDLDPGAPELKAASRYNRDNDFLVRHYAASTDLLVVMATMPANQCVAYDVLRRVDALEYTLRQLPGVESTSSLAGLAKRATVGLSDGSLKWYELVPNQATLNAVASRAPRELFNQNCDFLAIYVYLGDHRADTLARIVDAVERFAQRYDTPELKFRLAAGNAGIEAARNLVVARATHEMPLWLFGAVALLALIAVRSWQALIVALVPLFLTSILCEALMVLLGIGVKVATLPVIALGVGIGVDYALYVLSITLAELRAGQPLGVAYHRSLLFTGRVVLLTGLTLATGVAPWLLSPIKFQADMGILLLFMFLWNMLGALVLVPALAAFLLRPAAPRHVAAGAPLLPASEHRK